MLSKRTNILFSKDLWNKLVHLAQVKNTSVGQLVRNAVEEKYAHDIDLIRLKSVLEEIEAIRPHIKGKIDYKSLINYGRKY